MKTDGFYIKHKNIEEAFHFVGLTLGGGYNTYESLGEVERLKELEHVGVDRNGDVVFFDDPVDYGENAKEMTLQQVRDMFKKEPGTVVDESCSDSELMDQLIEALTLIATSDKESEPYWCRETARNALEKIKKTAPYGDVVRADKDVFFGEQKDVEWVDGLPPVGTVCEFRPSKYAMWAVVTILGYCDDFVWCLYEGAKEPFTNKAGFFRTLKSQEEIEREKAINDIDSILTDALDKDITMAEWIYDHDYRKINPISDEDIEAIYKPLPIADEHKRRYITGAKWAIDKMLGKK